MSSEGPPQILINMNVEFHVHVDHRSHKAIMHILKENKMHIYTKYIYIYIIELFEDLLHFFKEGIPFLKDIMSAINKIFID